MPQPVGRYPPLQNGGHCHTEGPPESWRLDGEGRPEGCLLHHPHSSSTSAISEIHRQQTVLPVHLSPFWPFMCPLDIHEGNETSDGPSECMGSQDNYIYRRYADPGGVQGVSSTTTGNIVVPPRGTRVHCQQREIPFVPNPEVGVPGVASGLAEPSTCIAQGEVGPDSQGGRIALPEAIGDSPTTLTACGEIERSNPSSSGSSLVLQSSSKGLAKGPSTGGSELQSACTTVQGISGRTGLVAESSDQLEWEDRVSDTSTGDDSIRCFPHRLGGSMRGGEHRGLLGPSGTTPPYQLLGTSGSRAGHEDLPQVTSRNISFAPAGQFYSCDIHQQPGRDCVTSPHFPGEISVALGSGERYHHHSSTYSRCIQWDSRRRVEAGERQIRLDAFSGGISENQSDLGTFGGGPVCLQIDPPTTLVFQLETRSSGRSSGCISARLEQGERLCQPSVVPDRTRSQQDSVTGSSSNSSGPSVEESGLVPSSSGNVGGLPTTYSPTRGSVAEGQGAEDNRDSPSFSRLACLRERYRHNSFSAQASELMLASWRTKSSQSYESSFGKWARWCAERCRNPVSGPIADIANFLAHLHEAGYL